MQSPGVAGAGCVAGAVVVVGCVAGGMAARRAAIAWPNASGASCPHTRAPSAIRRVARASPARLFSARSTLTQRSNGSSPRCFFSSARSLVAESRSNCLPGESFLCPHAPRQTTITVPTNRALIGVLSPRGQPIARAAVDPARRRAARSADPRPDVSSTRRSSGSAPGSSAPLFFVGLEAVQRRPASRSWRGYVPLRAHGERSPRTARCTAFRPWLLVIILPRRRAPRRPAVVASRPETRGGGGDAMIEAFHHENGVVRRASRGSRRVASILTLGRRRRGRARGADDADRRRARLARRPLRSA